MYIEMGTLQSQSFSRPLLGEPTEGASIIDQILYSPHVHLSNSPVTTHCILHHVCMCTCSLCFMVPTYLKASTSQISLNLHGTPPPQGLSPFDLQKSTPNFTQAISCSVGLESLQASQCLTYGKCLNEIETQ
jgi:hypothetical protein